jgi:hypothetical protein
MAFSAAGPSRAEMEIAASNLAGRWVVASGFGSKQCSEPGCRPTYDLAPCGDGWCGIEVKEGKTCGRTAFRLDAGTPGNSAQYGIEFAGSYDRAEGTQPYVIRANLYASPAPQLPVPQFRLSVRGNTGGDFQPFRRTFPLYMVLSREGDALCTQPKTS